MIYPKLEPVPIPTKGKSLLMRIWIWLFCSRKWRLVEDWYFDTKISEVYVKIVIPKDFIFDGASVPRWLWPILQPMGILMIPGLVHDYAYRYQKVLIVGKNNKRIPVYRGSQKFWDNLFRDISIQVNGCRFISFCSWSMLRVFGYFAWKNNRKIEAKGIAEDWKRLVELMSNI